VTKNSWKNRLATLLAIAIAWCAMGCAAINGAGPPAPLVEIPSAVSFPKSVDVGVGEVAPAGAGGAISFQLLQQIKPQVLPIGGEFYDAIVFGFTSNDLINAAVGGILGQLSLLDLPVNPVTRNFQADGVIAGTNIKIDFSDYDFDGDGANEGCTGCTCPTGCDSVCPTQALFADLKPVCYRIWNDPAGAGNYVRIMAGLMNVLPTKDDPATPEDETNPGVGTFRVSLEFQTAATPPQITSYGSNYNHFNPARPLDLITQYFLSFLSTTGANPTATVSFMQVQQTALDDVPNPNRLLKTIQESVNQLIRDQPDANSTFQYLARFRTDFDFWSGTFQNFLQFPGAAFAVPPQTPNFTDVCAQLTTAVGVNPGVCQDIGIDVTNVPFLDLLLPTDPQVNLPADFPATPTF